MTLEFGDLGVWWHVSSATLKFVNLGVQHLEFGDLGGVRQPWSSVTCEFGNLGNLGVRQPWSSATLEFGDL